MSDNKIKVQAFFSVAEIDKIKKIANSFEDSGLSGTISETIRFLTLAGLKSRQFDVLEAG